MVLCSQHSINKKIHVIAPSEPVKSKGEGAGEGAGWDVGVKFYKVGGWWQGGREGRCKGKKGRRNVGGRRKEASWFHHTFTY